MMREGNGGLKSTEPSVALSETSTLLETQEFGEMMEHVDEVNFSLDGLQPWQPTRIRRASLLSLLTVCSMAQRRRLLRARGMYDKIIDAILGLNFDDSVSTTGAATLFYVMANDVEADGLVDSRACIRFLLKLLNPPISHSIEKKAPKIRFNLLEIQKPQTLNSIIKGDDSSSRALLLKVKEILVSCSSIKPGSGNDDDMKRPELSSRWIALLTMEKACSSTVSFEDATGTKRKTGGKFKESLRELKGLDAIFDVVVDCHSALQGWLKKKSSAALTLKDIDSAAPESVVLLLKCLKIMENVTFMSKYNQDYLLNMKAKLDSDGSPLSFVGIVISCIKFLSGLSLLQNTCNGNNDGKLTCLPKNILVPTMGKNTDVQGYPMENIEVSHKRRKLSPMENIDIAAQGDSLSTMDRADCSASTSYSGASCTNTVSSKVRLHSNGMSVNSQRSSNGWISIRSTGSKVTSYVQSKRNQVSSHEKADHASDLSDPFAFEEHLGPSRWEQLSSKEGKTHICSQSFPFNENVIASEVPIVVIDDESSQATSEVNLQSTDNSRPSVDEEDPSLLEDCLLSSVKVLMNLTNDNPVGCQQIGASGGLDTLVSLITSHFSSLDMHFPVSTKTVERVTSFDKNKESEYLNNRKLHDHQLDFLVAILGLLVNLIEKDCVNRFRLASARVLVNQPGTSASKEIYREVVPMLCSIFMSNQGAVNTAREEEVLIDDDEAALLQTQREAEMMIIQAYTALLLAFLSTESATVKETIARGLPNHSLQILVPVLERFVSFHRSLNVISAETHAAVVKVIETCKES